MTNFPAIHLSEEERQRAADGTLDAADRARVEAHLGVCRDCATDVTRLTTLMMRIDESRRAPATQTAGLDGMWREIRQEIEGAKVVALDPVEPGVRSWRLRVDPWVIGVAASVAAITAVTVIQIVPPIVRSIAPPPSVTAGVNADSVLRFADDSIASYREEADQLLDELQLQRARLAPGTRAAIDDELKTVDLAIAELQAAVARDPRNPTLRTMLASSYRQKIDVLKKVSNAS
jgi:anti-sigma factor RsiW